MNSIALNNFMNSVGESVHSLNTICVGLSVVENGKVTKPSGLNISWNPKDKEISAKKSRNFAIKAILIFVAEAFNQYLNSIKSTPQGKKIFPDYETKQSKREKFEYIIKTLNLDKEYHYIFILLLIKWRNKIVHVNSDKKLEPQHEKELFKNNKLIHKNCCNLDIEETLENYKNRKETLKDFTTIIAITIEIVRRIDFKLFNTINDIDILEEWISTPDYFEKYKKINRLEEGELKKRKIINFLKMYFKNLDKSFEKEVIVFLLKNKITCKKLEKDQS